MLDIPDSKLLRKNPNKYFIEYIRINYSKSQNLSHFFGDFIYIIEGNCIFNDIELHKGDFLVITSNFLYEIVG